MRLNEWRSTRKYGFAEAARLLGIDGVNPGKTLARIEIGERQPDADMVERIAVLTDGAVSAADMHATRLAWLKANRPDKFPSDGDCHPAVEAGLAATPSSAGPAGFIHEAAE